MAMSRSTSASSSPWKSSWRNNASTLRCSSAGSACWASQPRPTPAEQVGVWACRHQIARQDRVDLVLQPGPLLHQMGPASDQTASPPGLIIGDPGLGQEVRRQTAEQGSGRRPCRSSPSPPRSPWSCEGSTPPPGTRPHEASWRSHRCWSWPPERPRRLARRNSSAQSRRSSGLHPDPALVTNQTVLDHGDLRERAMHIHPDVTHHQCSPLHDCWIEEPPGGHDRNGFALAAQSGQSQGRPSTNTSSQLKV